MLNFVGRSEEWQVKDKSKIAKLLFNTTSVLVEQLLLLHIESIKVVTKRNLEKAKLLIQLFSKQLSLKKMKDKDFDEEIK